MANPNQNNKNPNQNNKNFFNNNPLLAFAIFSIVLIMFFKMFMGEGDGIGSMLQSNVSQTKHVKYSQIKEQIAQGNIKSVKLTPSTVEAIGEVSGQRVRYIAQNVPTYDKELIPLLEEKQITYEGVMGGGWFSEILSMLLPILIFFAIWIFLANKMSKGMGGGILGAGKADKLINSEKPDTRFDDVQGVEEAKDEVKEIVDFLKYPERYIELGAKIPKGVLLVGPPGTGKTLLAKAVAGEASVPFFSVSGSSFIEMFVGVGASRVRDLFAQAKKEAPSIIFIDEIDAVGRQRGAGVGGGHDEREQTLNQLLVEMDGFEGFEAVIIIAATNRPDVLDPALLRPGRFDRQVVVGLPDVRGREQILNVHVKKVPLGKDVDTATIARGTPGFSGAELANLVNEAALNAARHNKRVVSMNEFEEAKDKLLMGAERRSMAMNEHEKINTAYHEAGHAIVGKLVPEHDPVYKVSIIPRGRALGVTMYLPEQDKVSQSRIGLLSNISTLFAGRIAEELMFGTDAVTTGASNDIERATQIARSMVTRWGFSKRLAPMQYEKDNEGSAYLGGSSTTMISMSDETAKIIDEEVTEIINSCYKKAQDLLEANKDILENMKDALLKYETIDADQIDDLMNRKEVRPPRKVGDAKSSDQKSDDNSKDEKSNDVKTEDKSTDNQSEKAKTENSDNASETKKDDNDNNSEQ